MTAHKIANGILVFAVAAAGCGDKSVPKGKAHESGAPSSAGDPRAETAGETPAKPKVALADAPDIDLLDNRTLLHLRRGDLVVPVASEGLRKYVNEYRDPWGEVVSEGGKSGRVLGARAAELRFGWHGDPGAATLVIRLHGGGSKQTIGAVLNGKTLGSAKVSDDWAVATLAISDGSLTDGENVLSLRPGSRGSVGGEAGYGAIHSIEIVPGDGAGADSAAWPALDPVAPAAIGGDTRDALTGFRSYAMYVEIPATGWLDLAIGAPAAQHVSITATTVDGKVHGLLDGQVAAGTWKSHRISLADLAGELVRLELASDSETVAWAAPRIALERATVREKPTPVRHSILVVVDALRSDRLALYGDTRVETPRITAEGRARGAWFLHNQAASPSSPPSHGSIQTGMTPRVHGVVGDKAQLAPGTPMISTVLGDAGIATAYYGNNAFGMGRLEKPGNWTEYHQPGREGLGIDCAPLIEAMLGFSKAQADEGNRFFISSLPYETHVPYRFHEGITDKYFAGPYDKPIGKEVNGGMLGQITGGSLKMDETRWKQLKALYDGEATYMDGCFGALLDGLAEQKRIDDTAIVLTSDHGEGMYEHGRMGHAFGHYAELGNVPFAIFSPGLVAEGMALDVVASHIDIAPTLIDLMGVDPPPEMQGESLLPIALRDGPWTPRVVSLEYGRSYALRARQWKYIVDYSGNESLYDLADDPTEQTDVKDSAPLALRYMRDLAGVYLAHRVSWRTRTFGTLNNHREGFLAHTGKAPK
jgi:arylsulfatase A-like enzyme